jgi:hypothetical protein
VGFESIGALYQALDKHGAERLSEEFLASAGKVQLQFLIEADSRADLQAAVFDATRGQGALIEC